MGTTGGTYSARIFRPVMIISRRISKPEGLHKGLFRYFFVLFGAAFVISFLISQYSEFVKSGAGFSPLAFVSFRWK